MHTISERRLECRRFTARARGSKDSRALRTGPTKRRLAAAGVLAIALLCAGCNGDVSLEAASTSSSGGTTTSGGGMGGMGGSATTSGGGMGGIVTVDDDGDGYPSDIDCNDADPAIHPGAGETCNGVDDDCDGIIDDEEGAAGCMNFVYDRDGDGYGAAYCLCGPTGEPVVADESDCDDSNALVYPGQMSWFEQDRGDGSFDYDCDGQESLQIPKSYGCSLAINYECTVSAGWCEFAGIGYNWTLEIPKCGEAGDFCSACYLYPAHYCYSGASPRVQGCR